MSLLRPDINRLPIYSSARAEFTGSVAISLDANENPFPSVGGLNRYPDGQYSELKRAISAVRGFSEKNLFLGSGSDECIDVLLKATTIPGKGSIIVFPPTYSMYEVQARVLGLTCIEWRREEDFSIHIDRFIEVNIQANLIFICSPNNPTGNTIPAEDIKKLLLAFPNTLIVVDEAYIEFSDKGSLSPLITEYSNLVIIRTLSKAMGLAGLRVGYLLAKEEIIEACDRVRLPYNISRVTERFALRSIKSEEKTKRQIAIIKRQREYLAEELAKNTVVRKVFPSDGNFLLALVRDAKLLRSELLKSGIVVRDRSGDYLCKECIRITIGTPEENKQLLEALQRIAENSPKKEKSASVPITRVEFLGTATTILFKEEVLFSSAQNNSDNYLLNSGVIKSLFLLADQQKFRLLVSTGDSKTEEGDSSESYSPTFRDLLSMLASQGINLTRVFSSNKLMDEERFLLVSRVENLEIPQHDSKESNNSRPSISITTQDRECVFQADSLYEALLYISRNAPDISISRKTKETEITCSLNLWGNGEVEVRTGIGFFDHMLCQMGFYGKLRLKIAALGDLEIDEHHTIEDVALVLGSAFDKSLGVRGGIRRYGFSVPMDEAICSSVIDLSGRSELVWNVEFKRERIGDMPTEMIKHFFKSFTNAAKVTLHISASGENEHHLAESIFKAFGQSLRGALRFDPLAMIPSTKGVL